MLKLAGKIYLDSAKKVMKSQDKKNEKLAAKWVLNKLERDWQKKLTIPQAKKMVAEKYQAAKLLLKP